MLRTKQLLAAALLVLPLLWIAGLDLAVAGSTQTGTIRGKVVDEKGEPLPGATVVLTSEQQIRDRAMVTDADGNFFAAALIPGDYKVTVSLEGYVTVQMTTIVQIDRTTPITVGLKAGQITETVTVTATRPVVSKTTTEKAQVVERKFTDNLPVGRSYQSLIQFAPGVVGGSNPNMLGGTQNSNVYLVDGINGNDPVTGTFGFNMTFDSIEAADIKLTGVSAEYGKFQGGLTNVITKSGSNNWTGSLRDVITSGAWTEVDHIKAWKLLPETNYGWTRPPIIQRDKSSYDKQHGVVLSAGGPIVPDNAWFFLSYDRRSTKGPAPLGNPEGGPFGNGTYVNFFSGDDTLGKITWQVANNHRLSYTYSQDPALVTRDYYFLFWGLRPYEDYNVDLQKQGGFIWGLTWAATWTPQLVTDFKVTRFKNSFAVTSAAAIPYREDLPHSRTDDMAPYIDVGGESAYDTNVFDEWPEDRLRKQYEGAATYFLDTTKLGTHTIKVGVDWQKQENIGASVLQGNALFYGYIYDYENPFDLDSRGYNSWTDFTLPSVAGPTNKYTAIFVQDDWQLNENLAFNLGLRYEKSENENDVGEKVIDDSGFAPRLGVSWDITGAGKHVVKATMARYLAGINLTTLSPFARAAGGQSAYNIWFNTNRDEDDNPLPGTPNWELQSVISPEGGAFFADDLAPQRIDEVSIGYEYAFSPEFGVSAKAVYRKWKDVITQVWDYSDGASFLIYNNDDARRMYRGYIFTAEKRFSNNWEISASYTRSKSEGNVTSDSGFDSYGSFPLAPDKGSTINRFGLLPWDVKDAIKIQGFYQMPLKTERHKVTLGGLLDYRSGFPFAKSATRSMIVDPTEGVRQNVLYYFEPRGIRRAPPNWNIDTSFNYQFLFTKKVIFETRLEIFNITGNQAATAVSSNWSLTSARTRYIFGDPTSYANIQNARSYRVQFSLLW